MQQLAREFNFSETTFVLPPSDPSCTCRVRIFTPRQELPFAGHATVGTAAVLASPSDDKQFMFEEGIGPVRVDVDRESIRLYLDSPRYESSSEAPPTAAVGGMTGRSSRGGCCINMQSSRWCIGYDRAANDARPR